jgi:hypothetical protein
LNYYWMVMDEGWKCKDEDDGDIDEGATGG